MIIYLHLISNGGGEGPNNNDYIPTAPLRSGRLLPRAHVCASRLFFY